MRTLLRGALDPLPGNPQPPSIKTSSLLARKERNLKFRDLILQVLSSPGKEETV